MVHRPPLQLSGEEKERTGKKDPSCFLVVLWLSQLFSSSHHSCGDCYSSFGSTH